MIIGKDKERVRRMNIDLQLAEELIEKIQYDMACIADNLHAEKLVDTTDFPYTLLYHDIGRCIGWLEHKG